MIWPCCDEDLAVVLEEVGAFHAGAAGLGADEQGPVGVLEADVRVAGEDHVLEEREGAVVELHGDALEGVHGLFDRDFEELQDHRLIGAEHLAGGDAEQEGVTDLPAGPVTATRMGCFMMVLERSQ